MRQTSQFQLVAAGFFCAALVLGCANSMTGMTNTQAAGDTMNDNPRRMANGNMLDGPMGQADAPIDPTGMQMFGAGGDMNAASFENRLVTNVLQHSFTTQGGDFDPDLDLPGETVVFSSTRNSPRPDIFLKSVNGYAITQLTSDPADDIRPRFSPCGTKVAFCSNRDGNWDIWIINRDGTGLMQLTCDPADEIAPTWAPDGTHVAFCTWGRRSGQWEIWEMSAAQPGVRRFLAFGMFPAWSPDGRYIAFQRARQRDSRWFGIWTIELVNGDVRHPTEVAFSDDGACVAPSWSPDGKLLAFCTVRNGAAQPANPMAGQGGVMHGPQTEWADVWAIEMATGARTKLTDGSAVAFNPVWASTGRVFFVSSRNGAENIWSVAVGNAAARPTASAQPTHTPGATGHDAHALAGNEHGQAASHGGVLQPGNAHEPATRVLGHQVEKPKPVPARGDEGRPTAPKDEHPSDHDEPDSSESKPATEPAESGHDHPKDPH